MENGRSLYAIVLGDNIPLLKISPPFVAKYGAFFPEVITLKTDGASDASWPVEIEKINGHYYLCYGWLDFVKDNAVECANFLTLRFVEPSRIVVSVFNYNGLKRKNAVYRFTWHNRMRNNMVIKGSVCKPIRLRDETYVTMRNMEGHVAKVRVFNSGDGRTGLSDGWAAFVSASNLVENQTYQFDCIRCDKKVQIQLSLVKE